MKNLKKDPELAEYADRADMDDEDDEQKRTLAERLIPIKKDEEKKKDVKPDQSLKTSSRQQNFHLVNFFPLSFMY